MGKYFPEVLAINMVALVMWQSQKRSTFYSMKYIYALLPS